MNRSSIAVRFQKSATKRRMRYDPKEYSGRNGYAVSGSKDERRKNYRFGFRQLAGASSTAAPSRSSALTSAELSFERESSVNREVIRSNEAVATPEAESVDDPATGEFELNPACVTAPKSEACQPSVREFSELAKVRSPLDTVDGLVDGKAEV